MGKEELTLNCNSVMLKKLRLERFYEDLQDLQNQHQKKMSFSSQGPEMQKQGCHRYLE